MKHEIPESLYKHFGCFLSANPRESIFLLIARVREMIQTDGVAKTRALLVLGLPKAGNYPKGEKTATELLIEILDDVYNGEEVGK